MLSHAPETPDRLERNATYAVHRFEGKAENDNPHLSRSIVHILARDRVKFRLAWSSEVWYRARVWLIVTAMIAA